MIINTYPLRIWIRPGSSKSAKAGWPLGSLLRRTKCWEALQIRSFPEALPWLVKLVTSPAVSIVATKFLDCCYCFSSLEIARLNSEISWAEIDGNVGIICCIATRAFPWISKRLVLVGKFCREVLSGSPVGNVPADVEYKRNCDSDELL